VQKPEQKEMTCRVQVKGKKKKSGELLIAAHRAPVSGGILLTVGRLFAVPGLLPGLFTHRGEGFLHSLFRVAVGP
jgi:hypothetical protein